MTARPEDTLVVYPWEHPLGARPLRDGRGEFRVWAPRAGTLSLEVAGRSYELDAAGHGVFEGVVSARPGDDYVYVVDGERFPDPCSRWQPEGLRGPSRLFDARALPGAADSFAAPRLEDVIIYELHIGTFSQEGDVRRRDPAPRPAGRARDHRDRGDAGRRVPPAPAVGAMTASTCRPPSPATAGRRDSPSSSPPPTPTAWR